jgi:hypothetical protein
VKRFLLKGRWDLGVRLAWRYDRSSGVWPPEVKLPAVTGRKGDTNKATAWDGNTAWGGSMR